MNAKKAKRLRQQLKGLDKEEKVQYTEGYRGEVRLARSCKRAIYQFLKDRIKEGYVFKNDSDSGHGNNNVEQRITF